jgi:hypothetical protein
MSQTSLELGNEQTIAAYFLVKEINVSRFWVQYA